MTIDPKLLLQLLAIAEEGSFNKAALKLNLSQPALSAAIGTLERRLGHKVLTRTWKGAVINEIGEVLVRRALELRSLLHAAEREAEDRSAGNPGPVVFGATPAMFIHLVPELLVWFTQRFDTVTLTAIEGWGDELEEMLEASEIDFYFGSILSADGSSDAVIEEFLFEDPVELGVRPSSRWASAPSVSLEDLQDELWVLPTKGAHLRHIEALFSASGVDWPRHCVHTNSMAMQGTLVAQAGAVTIINMRTMIPKGYGIVGVPLAHGGVKRYVLRQRRHGQLSPTASLLVDELRRLIAMVHAQGQASARTKC